MSRPPIVLDHVTKTFVRGEYHDSLRDIVGRLFRGGRRKVAREQFNAVDDMCLEVPASQAIGIIGPNGCGKSTTLKLLTGIYVPTSGDIHVEGRVAPLIEVGAGFHPDLTGRENIYLNGSISGMTRKEIDLLFDDIVEFSGLAPFLDTPVKRYSSGMYMRLGFSIASHVPSEILIVDEVLAVGDIGFRARCIERMHKIKNEGRTVVFVSHSPYQVRSLCDRVIYVIDGKISYDGDPVEGTRRYEQDLLHGRVGDRKQAEHEAKDAPASFVSAQILMEPSDEGMALRPGEGIEVLVRYRLTRKPEKPVHVAVGFLRGDGVTACVLHTRDLGVELPSEPGDHAVVARFDDVSLYAGRYSVECLLWDNEMVVALDQLTAGSVEVKFDDRPLINRPGVYLPGGAFRVGEP